MFYSVTPSFPHQVPGETYFYAGFWRRACASLIDGFILVIIGIFLKSIMMITFFYSISSLNKLDFFPFIYNDFEIYLNNLLFYGSRFFSLGMIMLGGFIYYMYGLIYFAGFQSSSWQGTLGMRVLDMKIMDDKGHRISFARASVRYLVSPLSFMMMGIGYLMILFTRHKQALHDLITSVYVIRGPLQKTFYLNDE